jgi:uncharacterized protein YjeT (DUF2065 family)
MARLWAPRFKTRIARLSMPPETRLTLRAALFILRLALSLYLLLEGLGMIATPSQAQATISALYHLELSQGEIALLGVSQVVLAGVMSSGALRVLSYGLGLLSQTMAVLARYAFLLTPFEPGHLLQFAAIPVLAGFALLFALRDEDTILSLDVMAAEARR